MYERRFLILRVAILVFLVLSQLYSQKLAVAYPLHIYTNGKNLIIMVLEENSTTPIIVYSNATINVNGTVKIIAFSYDPRVFIKPNNTEIYVNKETSIYIQVYTRNQSSIINNNLNNKFELDIISSIFAPVIILIGFLLLLRNSNKSI
ncbi:MAG: hypothetical protein QXV69_05390 [Sulfolobaceae archaeon]